MKISRFFLYTLKSTVCTPCLLLLLTIGMFHISACKSEDSTTEDRETVPDVQESAEFPTADFDASQWTFLTSGIFHNNVTISVGEDPKTNPREGHWIDFHNDGTYKYGIWDQTSHSGLWFYDSENSLLDLQPSDDTKPSQWQVMHRDHILIFIGTAKYRDNALQIRYIRHDSLPTR